MSARFMQRMTMAATKVASNRVAATLFPVQAYNNCQPGDYCDYNGTDGANVCFPSMFSVPNWGVAGGNGGSCRNLDKSFANRMSGLVRLYFSPNYQNAWACVDSGWFSNNLNQAVYTFNNGPNESGYSQEIWLNVASSKIDSGSCSNPRPERWLTRHSPRPRQRSSHCYRKVELVNWTLHRPSRQPGPVCLTVSSAISSRVLDKIHVQPDLPSAVSRRFILVGIIGSQMTMNRHVDMREILLESLSSARGCGDSLRSFM